nr:hypothetical protein [Tanacetum cinerariifolium]
MILESIQNGPLICPMIKENCVTRPRKYSELTPVEAIQTGCDVKATNIILQGLPPDVYALTAITHNAAYQSDDLDAYDSDCDELNTAKLLSWRIDADDVAVPAAPTLSSPTTEPSPPLQVAQLEQDKIAQDLKLLSSKRGSRSLEKKRRSKSSCLKRFKKGRKNNDNATTKEVSDVEPTVFNDEEYVDKHENINWNVVVEQMQEKQLDNIRKYQSLKRKLISVAQDRKNMIVYLKNMAGYKMKHFKGTTYDKESFKKLKAVEVSGSESTKDTPTDDPKEMSEEDVKNMLEIVLISEFKVEVLQVKHDMYMLTEKDYPLSNGVMTLILSTRLQVEEDSEMTRDLVMKIFMKANQLKSRSLDTSSK